MLVGKGETVAGRLGAGLIRRTPGVHEIRGYALIDHHDTLASNAFAVERRAKLFGMVDIVDDGDVLAKKRLAHSPGQAGTLVLDGGRGKVVKQKTHYVEGSGRLKNDRVAARSKFDGILRQLRFAAGDLRQRVGIKVTNIGSVCFRPACRRAVLHG